jgi:hypothetical protein
MIFDLILSFKVLKIWKNWSDAHSSIKRPSASFSLFCFKSNTHPVSLNVTVIKTPLPLSSSVCVWKKLYFETHNTVLIDQKKTIFVLKMCDVGIYASGRFDNIKIEEPCIYFCFLIPSFTSIDTNDSIQSCSHLVCRSSVYTSRWLSV